MRSLYNDVTYVKPISNFPGKKIYFKRVKQNKKKHVNKNRLWSVRKHFPVKDRFIQKQKPFNRLASQIK